jgi:hypothetical protein
MSDRSNHKLPVRPDLKDMWNDLALTRSRVGELAEQGKRSGDLGPAQAALGELQLKTAHLEKLLQEMQAPIKAVLGKNFLGTAEWKQGFEVKVGAPPSIPEQAEVYKRYAADYREAKALEVMTAALLNDVVNGEPRMLAPMGDNSNFLRCVESKSYDARVVVGNFYDDGLNVRFESVGNANASVGIALARRA